ncbi:MAG: PhzF family phenazine biosynthesis protein [candidate division Zixibacteria bacterium]|nr:PhzF family phenazine biosynthesis protein [candidate division Zixibacteria bacterium]
MSQDRSITIFQVDSFSNVPFKGNPAGVCILEKSLDDQTMQNIAAEMNLAETAFVVPITAGPLVNAYKFKLRWFTPTTEVPLCGHATLATARVLYDIYQVKNDTLTFDTESGDLMVSRINDMIQLDFPAGDPHPIELPDYFKNALNFHLADIDDMFHEAFQCRVLGMLLLRFKDASAISKIAPNFSDLAQAEDSFGSKGVVVTAEGEKPYDFISRFFAPSLGINEDPVTGAAHTVLTPYWSVMLKKKKMVAFQVSKRGGELNVELKTDPKGFRHRVLISGQAIIVLEGVMKLAVDD